MQSMGFLEPGDLFSSIPVNNFLFFDNRGSYIYRIYKCERCTYIEIHDVPQQELEEKKQIAIKKLTQEHSTPKLEQVVEIQPLGRQEDGGTDGASY